MKEFLYFHKKSKLQVRQIQLNWFQSKILKVWNNIDKRITKYHVEAADNAKFLGAIEKTSHSIYLEDPGQVCSLSWIIYQLWFSGQLCPLCLTIQKPKLDFLYVSGTVGIWNPTIQNLEAFEIQMGFQMVQFSTGRSMKRIEWTGPLARLIFCPLFGSG